MAAKGGHTLTGVPAAIYESTSISLLAYNRALFKMWPMCAVDGG